MHQTSGFYGPHPRYVAPEPSGKAIAALILTLVGPFTCFLLTIAGLILGHGALGEIRRSRGALTGEGLATAAVIIGWLTVGLIVLPLLLFLLLLLFLGLISAV